MTLNEAAVSLGVTTATLRQQVKNGSLRAEKHGRDWWVTDEAVAEYRARHLGQAGRKPKGHVPTPKAETIRWPVSIAPHREAGRRLAVCDVCGATLTEIVYADRRRPSGWRHR